MGKELRLSLNTEHLYQRVLEHTHDLVVLTDIRGRVLYASPSHERFLGYKPEELVGTNGIKMFHPEDQGRMTLYLAKCLTSSKPISAMGRVRHKDGHYVTVEGIGSLIREKSGLPGMVLVTSRDITERIGQEEELRESKQKFRIVVEYSNDLVVLTNPDGTFVYASPSWERVAGYDPEDLLGVDAFSLIHPEDHETARKAMTQGLVTGSQSPVQLRLRHKEGNWLTVQGVASVIPDENGEPSMFVASCQDITELKEIEENLRKSEESFRLLAEALPQLVWTADPQGVFTYCNIRWRDYAGSSLEKTQEKGREDAVHPDDWERSRILWKRSLESGTPYEITYRLKRAKDQMYRWFLGRAVPVFNEKKEITTWIGTCTDIHDAKTAEEEMRHQALHDSLTGLPNRDLLEDRLQQALNRSKVTKKPGALIFLDLDRFKIINDSLGHHAGDALLSEVGRRLAKHVRPIDTVARFGGDEFLILLPEVKGQDEAVKIIKEIFTSFKESFRMGRRQVHLNTSVGLVLFPQDGKDTATLLKNADNALYQAKESGRSTYKAYNASMHTRAMQKLTIQSELRKAIKNHELCLYFQPIVDLNTQEVVKAEALVRWNHPTRGFVLPNEFIPVAEEGGLIVEIGEWAIEQSLLQVKKWESQGVRDCLIISVNISPIQFIQPDFIDKLRKICKRLKVKDLSCLQFEITEGTLMNNLFVASEQLYALKELGANISIDDFGTGYSSLSYLKELPIDQLKIDQSFIRHCLTDERDRAIVATIISLARSLHLNVCAEGIEHSEQLGLLRGLSCDAGQGYLFSKPLAPDEFARHWKKGKATKVLK